VLALLTFYEILKYIPPVLPGILFVILWSESIYSELCYLLLITFMIIFYHSLALFQNFPEEMIVNLESISNISGKVLNSVKWNFIKADLIRKIRIFHFQVWSLALIYELLNKNFGIGDILFFAMSTGYLSVIITIAIITALIIFLVNKLLIIQENKFLFANE
jgi:ABC-type nitrate/sulfonate/bicarbonate transport system permease component